LIDQLNLNRSTHYFTQTKVIALVRGLTECIDQSIKVMKGSPLYLEQGSLSLQMQRFSQMLQPFQRIMVKWMAYTNDYVSADKSYVVENCASSQEEILAVINEHFQSLTNSENLDLSPIMASNVAALSLVFSRRNSATTISSARFSDI